MTKKEIDDYNNRVDYREWWEIQAARLMRAATRPVYVGIWVLFILDCLGIAFILSRFTSIGASPWGAAIIGGLIQAGIAGAILWASLLVLTLINHLRIERLLDDC